MAAATLTATAESATSVRLRWQELAYEGSAAGLLVQTTTVVGLWFNVSAVAATQGEWIATGLLPQTTNYFRLFNSSNDFVTNIANATTFSPFNGTQGKIIVHATPTYPRNGEGSIRGLINTSAPGGYTLLLYVGRQHGSADNAPSDVVEHRSYDLGQTWTEAVVIAPSDGYGKGLVGTAWAANGTLALSYMVSNPNHLGSWRAFQLSYDNGTTWTEPRNLTDGSHPYMSGAMDRMRTLSTGRIIVPVHSKLGDANASQGALPASGPSHLVTDMFASDDNGETWQKVTSTPLDCPLQFFPTLDYGAWECSVDEWQLPGGLGIVCRTATGWLWAATSSDGGATWTALQQTAVANPECPPQLKAIPAACLVHHNVGSTLAAGGQLRLVLLNDPHTNMTQDDWMVGRRWILASRVTDPAAAFVHSSSRPERSILDAPRHRINEQVTPPAVPGRNPTEWMPPALAGLQSYRELEVSMTEFYSYPSITIVGPGSGEGPTPDGGTGECQAVITYYHLPPNDRQDTSVVFRMLPLTWFLGNGTSV